ncbi:MAG TPA: RNA methyltransferase [Opitutus sp.]|nr:RNA methyltransferase [Opitutus sp.]
MFREDFRFVAGVKKKEITVCGLAAVKAQFASNPKAMVRLFFDQPTGRKIGPICKAFAQAKKVYRCVEPAELEKIAGSIHHGGIVAVVEAAELRAPDPGSARDWARRREPVLVLDGVGNAHNLGAIVRTAAFFGVRRLILPDDPAAALPGEAAHRVAEGGMAYVEIARVRSLPVFLRELVLAGYEVVGAATRGGRADVRSSSGKPIALVLGNEERGLSPPVAETCTRLVTLPGSGTVESLNVSVAAAILLWELVVRR